MYFTQFSTVDQIKTEYRRLAKLHHPDLGGSTIIMQAINAEYQEALARCDGQTSQGTDGKAHTYTYSQETEQAIMDKIAELLGLKLDGIEIWLIGTWVWVDGDTYPVREQLKAVKLEYNGKRKKWYWHNGPKYRRQSKGSFGDLASKYGASHFKNETEAAIV